MLADIKHVADDNRLSAEHYTRTSCTQHSSTAAARNSFNFLSPELWFPTA